MFDQKFLTQKLDKFVALLDMNSVVEYEFLEKDGLYIINVSFRGDNLGYAIGYRGKNIQSLQFILSIMLKNILQKEMDLSFDDVSKIHIFVDVGDYREQSVKRLHRLLDGKMDEARTLGEYIDLPAMSPAERREVHMYVDKFDDISSESIGEGSSRFVRITPLSEEALGIISEDDSVSEFEEIQE